ncbi:hypothetical protein, partial [Streptomyces sp. NPDC058953]|uniref:hypothetical protein n=1 Tax=Streptomyces sp. NPDC058953 TaxID=3346676 RepID=UPI0036ABE1A7
MTPTTSLTPPTTATAPAPAAPPPVPSPAWAAVFLPAALPREGRMAGWAPGGGLPDDTGDTLTVVEPGPPPASGAVARTVPALLLPVADALPAVL